MRASLLLPLALIALVPATALAVPSTSSVEGALTSAGGGAAADGDYDLTFSIYTSKTAQSAAWSEGPVKVAVKGGRFSYALGTSKPLDAKALAALAKPWFGVKVGADPELPRQPLHSVAFAHVAQTLACTGCVSASQVANGGISAAKVGFNYAGSTTKGGPASDLACTGCVSSKEMKFDGDIDLGGNSLKAKNGTFTGDLAAGTVTATSFVGDGSKLTGIKTPSGECKTAGEVVKGINADGSLKCVAALDPKALPKDGLNEISNDLISNQFIDTIETAQKKVPIPDNQGSEAVSNLTFPNIGIAQKFDMFVHVENTDLSKVAITVLPPNDKKTGWVLCDPCGAKDAKIFKKTYNNGAKPKSGDIGYWIGKNPQGLWNLKVKDTSFCIVQAPGNAKYCNPTKKEDGWIETWNIKIQTLSNQKIAVAGNQFNSGSLEVGKDLTVKGNLKGNAKIAKGVFAELAGNNWKQCSWHNLNSGLDVGLVVTCPYTKAYDGSVLRLVYNGTLRSGYGCNSCCKEWYFTIDGKECTSPAAIEGVRYQHIPGASWSDLHHHGHIEGICRLAGGKGIASGARKIELRIRNCAGYGNNDGYTGWNSTSRIIIQEMPLGQ